MPIYVNIDTSNAFPKFKGSSLVSGYEGWFLCYGYGLAMNSPIGGSPAFELLEIELERNPASIEFIAQGWNGNYITKITIVNIAPATGQRNRKYELSPCLIEGFSEGVSSGDSGTLSLQIAYEKLVMTDFYLDNGGVEHLQIATWSLV